jgi:uridine kinase
LKYLSDYYQEVNKEENTFINMGGFKDQDTYDFKLTINDLKNMKKNKAWNKHTINDWIKEIKKRKLDIFIISIW